MRRFVIFILALCFLSASAYAQTAQVKYNSKIRDANEIRAKMGAAGITKEEYNQLNTQYQQLQEEIKELESVLKADADYSKKLNDAKLAYNEGNTAYKKGLYEAAITSYDRALNLDENNSRAL